MTLLLQRLAQPQHRLWLAALVLAAIGLAVAALRPPQAHPNQRGPGPAGQAQALPDLGSLIKITADPRLLIDEAKAARAANAALPLLRDGLQAALPFGLPPGVDLSGVDRARQCLALAMYYEAAFEGEDGRRAVAQVVLNRVRHPAFPNNVCAVVFQRSASNVCQFTFACDGAMARPRLPALWQRTLIEAGEALAGKVYAPVGMATHYHADYVFPYWAPRLEKIAIVGTHQFYRWPGGWGLRRAFTSAYDGIEPAPADLALASPNPEAPIVFPPEFAAIAAEATPARVENEGGFVDPSKGWIPRIAQPSANGQAAGAQAPLPPLAANGEAQSAATP